MSHKRDIWVNHVQLRNIIIEKPNVKIFEVGFNTYHEFVESHIPGAMFLDTCYFEQPPLWKIVGLPEIYQTFKKFRITPSSTVILYGRQVAAAARVAHIMLYAGLSDIRLLDGDYAGYKQSNLPTESGGHNLKDVAMEGVVAFIANRSLVCDKSIAKSLLEERNASLVSVRSPKEVNGRCSGYSYIKQKGDIIGAKWGHAGTSAYLMEDYFGPDNYILPLEHIERLWESEGILKHHKVAFYCGTAWRASVAFLCAYSLGWKDICVYDGGWLDWIQEECSK
ncbi:3-mercaptopyruvate sulfurtransferase [Acrasis kona]|uniref:3-mercaptopyruvate sulfurtransferase n=1 Tax=Acrasis kona TaxID=1008807 RepID=A0AAW2ZPP0_9EUKA